MQQPNSDKNYSLKLLLILFLAYLYASMGESFFMFIPLYIKELNGNELDAGYISAFTAVGALGAACLINFIKINLNSAYIASIGCFVYLLGMDIFIYINKMSYLMYIAGIFLGIGSSLTILSSSI